jgi:hypothetical protein
MAGAMAFVNKTRHARVLNAMTASAAKRFGLEAHEAGDFFRVDSAKHTHTGSTRPVWRRKIGVGLGNGRDDGEGCIIGESNVGVITAWTPPNGTVEVDFLEAEQIEGIKKAVEGGMNRRSVQSSQWAGNAVASVLGLSFSDPLGLATVKAHLEVLIDGGHLIEVSRKVKGRETPFLLPADGIGLCISEST